MQLKNLIGTAMLGFVPARRIENGGIVPTTKATCLDSPFNVSKGTSQAPAHNHTFEVLEVLAGTYPAEPAKVVLGCFYCGVEISAYDTSEVL